MTTTADARVEMTDLEKVRLCAEAMEHHIAFGTDAKLPFWCHVQWPDPHDNGGLFKYDPLHDDAQAMALMKRFKLSVQHHVVADTYQPSHWSEDGRRFFKEHADLNRAIVECVAKMQAAS